MPAGVKPIAWGVSAPILAVFAGLLFLLFSFTSHHYWDEYFYLYSTRHNAPLGLLQAERDLAQGLFPLGFFSAKLGFVFVVWGLTHVVGDGYVALVVIQFLFALLVLAMAAANHALLRELLPEREAGLTALVFLSLPVSLYLGFKVLSETPSALLTTIACWAYLRSFRAVQTKASLGFLGVAVLALSAGVFARFTSFLLFGGFIVGLLAWRHERFHWTSVVIRAGVVFALSLGVMATAYTLIGVTIDQFAELISSTMKRTPGLGVKIFALAMTVQCFAPVLLWALKPPYPRPVLAGIVWAGICALPFIVSSQYLEPRHFYMALLPLAIIMHSGLQGIAHRFWPRNMMAAWSLMLGGIVLANRMLFAPLMPYELDQRQFAKTMTELVQRYGEATYICSWISDYSFLRFAFPHQGLTLALSEVDPEDRGVFHTEGFQRWVGDNRYIGSLTVLKQAPEPWIYLGWTFNPVVLQLEKHLEWLGLDYPRKLVKREALRGNHLAFSWIWSRVREKLAEHRAIGVDRLGEVTRGPDPSLTLQPVLQIGDYQAFKVRLSEPSPRHRRLSPRELCRYALLKPCVPSG